MQSTIPRTAGSTPSRLKRPVLAVQLLITLTVLAFVRPSVLQLACLLVLWLLTFRPIDRRSLALFVAGCVVFTVMNALSLRQGIFRFTRPDVLGMPYYELAMWGFYLLHTRQMVDGPVAARPNALLWALLVAFAVAFSAPLSSDVLLYCTLCILAIALAFFHDRYDLAYASYLLVLGFLVEWIGTATGQWAYPSPSRLGFPFWFATLWAGVGFFLRRVVLPLIDRIPLSREAI